MCARSIAFAQADVKVLRFPHTKDDLRRISVSDGTGEYDVYRMAPRVLDWPAARVPDEVNPRSHNDQCLKSSVAKAIEETLRLAPEDFWLANRGGFILAQRVKFDPRKSIIEIELADPELHGIADGATTNAVIKKLQEECSRGNDDLKKSLSVARFNLDVVVGLTDSDRIAKLVQGRNRSVQVKEWSLADFKGQFDWLKELIERKDGPFRNRIGWEENAGKPVSVLDLISLMTLFHPIYDDPTERRRKAPTVAYSSKGTADRRFADSDLAKGYRSLESVLEALMHLHDHVYANFEPTYEIYNREVHNKGAKLGKRRGVDKKKAILPFTGETSDYTVDKGLLYPLLASLRSLLRFNGSRAEWRVDPIDFFNDYGPELVGLLFEQYLMCGKSPTTTGKTRAVYTALHNEARLLVNECS